ncbi:hypothetical protein H6G36_29865 [Anabaena minutissima FACHB-250]|nr:hypothetical protein [Anabaena minutissima FACHB-250]
MENNSVNLADSTPDNSLQSADNPADDRQNIDSDIAPNVDTRKKQINSAKL